MPLRAFAKALHVAAVAIWVGGLLVAALAWSACGRSAGSGRGEERHWLGMVRTWDRRVTSPAMVAAWSLGVALAVQAGWLASGWLIAKLSVVVALSGPHRVLSGGLRRAARGSEPAGSAFRVYAVPAVIGGVLFIAVMAVVKPF